MVYVFTKNNNISVYKVKDNVTNKKWKNMYVCIMPTTSN